jgi:nucleoside-diphosphate-sugar epimerase
MILVTGGTGLVGSHLLYHLAQKNDSILAIYRTEEKLQHVKKVFAYYTENTDTLWQRITWIQADITDIPSLTKVFAHPISYVYHCAALVSFKPSDYMAMRQVNIDGTANIVNFCVDAKVKKLCFVSSIAAVGDSLHGRPVNEENEWNDNSDNHGYAITKYGAEMEVWRASQEGVPVVVVNPGVILGSGYWEEGSGKLFSQVAKGFKYYTQGVTGFIGVHDVVETMLQLTESTKANERYILVSENKSYRDILNAIADALNKPRPSIGIGKIATEIFWRIDWLLTLLTRKDPLLTKNSARSSHNKTFYSTDKVKAALGWEFTPIEKVIKAIAKDYRS